MQRKEFIDRLFAAAKRAGITECEAWYSDKDECVIDVLSGEINEYSVSTRGGLSLRGLFGGKMGYASTEAYDEEAIDMLVDGVIDNARLIESEDEEFIYGGEQTYPEAECFNPSLADMPVKDKIDAALCLEKAAVQIDPRVARVQTSTYVTEDTAIGIVNTKGLNVQYRANIAGAYVVPVAQDGEKVHTDVCYRFARDQKEIDISELAKTAVTRAVEGLNAKSVPSGQYRVAFRNDVAATLLATFASVFSADAAQKGMSLLKGKEGAVIASEDVSIIDDPLRKNGLASVPFDAEGVPAYTKSIVENGKLLTLLHNLKTAAKQGVRSTGNAAKAGYASPVGVSPTNFYIAPSDLPFDELLMRLGDGILITDLMGMHSGANQISGDFSLGARGMRVTGGKIAEPVEQITVAGNFFTLLTRIEAVASDLIFGMPRGACFGSPGILVGMMPIAGK